MSLLSRHWMELTWTDFAAADMARTVAVLPLAAIEQHGPHLPVGVDSLLAEGYLARVHARLPDDLPALFLPLQTVGKSNEHLSYPGTVTLGWEQAVQGWIEIGESVARAGCRKLVIVNSHGGNVAAIDIVARELRVHCRMLAVHCSWMRLGLPPGLFSADETRLGIHGGDVETSLMLAFRPDLVRMDRARNFTSTQAGMEQRHAVLRATQPVGFGWMSQDLNPAGTVGDASAATREKGEAAAEHAAEAFVALLRDVAAFDLAALEGAPEA